MSEPPIRSRILDEARDLFVAQGAAAVTMRGVAARVGVTPMALYRYFASREDLLAALVAQGHATFLRYLSRALHEKTPLARLAGAGEQYLRFGLEHPQSYAVMFMERDVPVGRATEGEEVATFRFLVDRIRDCAAAGDLRVTDAEEAALVVWAHVHGLVSLFLAGKLQLGEAEFADLYRRSVAALLQGLAAPERGSTGGRHAAPSASARPRAPRRVRAVARTLRGR